MSNVIFTTELYVAACERLKKKLAARQAAKDTVERIAAGAQRSSFSAFLRSFEEVVSDFDQSRASAPKAHKDASGADLSDCTKS
jgi:hypothetical protein